MLDAKLATELGGVWLSAYNKILDFEQGKRRQGISHALEVENNIGLILEEFDVLKEMKAKDLFILSASAVLHDLDKAMKRTDEYVHGASGADQLQERTIQKEFNLDPRKAEAIGYLIATHDKGNFDVIPEDPFIIDSPPRILLRSLAAIFRLADMLDLSYERCPKVIERIRGIAFEDARELWKATETIGGWRLLDEERARVLLQVIRRHSQEDELSLLRIVDSLNEDLTPSHKKYLENCVIISEQGKRISVALPTRFELDKMGLIFEETGGLEEFYDRILKRYLEKLHKNNENVDLGGLGVTSEKTTPLSKIFIDIGCRRSRRYRSLPRKLRNCEMGQVIPLAPSNTPTSVLSRLVNFEPLSTEEVIRSDGVGHLVVLGRTGTGKSTIAQHLCLVMSSQSSDRPIQIPFKIPARFYISEKTKKGSNYSLLDYIHDDVNYSIEDTTKCPRAFVEYCFKENGSLLILDGLDEVSNASQRQEVITDLLSLMQTFEGVRVVVTSRTDGYEEAPLSWAGFLHVELEAVGSSDVDTFIREWYGYRQPDPRIREEKIGKFSQVKEEKAFQQLASNPLLLTIIALVNESGSLPRLRTELYNTCVRAFIEEREDVKNLLWYDVKEVRSAHNYLGYWMQSRLESTEHQQEVDAETLRQSLIEYLSSQSPRPREIQQVKATKLITLARNRIGLITENRTGGFSFGLRSMQEYFAACYIDKKAYGIKQLWELVGKKVFNPYWHEVIRFLGGMLENGREQFFASIIRERYLNGIALVSEIVLENPSNEKLLLHISENCAEAVLKTSSENYLNTLTDFLIQFLETDIKDYLLSHLELECTKNPLAALDFLAFLIKQRRTKPQVDFICNVIIRSWNEKEYRKVCAETLHRLAKEIEGEKEDVLLDLLDVFSQSDEGRRLVVQEAKNLGEKQMYYVLLPLGNRPSLQDLRKSLSDRLKLHQI